MNLASAKSTKHILASYHIRPRRGLGQNFLVDLNTVKKLIGAAHIQPEDIVLEIGPGIGTLTQELAALAKHVVAIEKDPHMVVILKQTLAPYKNVEIIRADALKFNYKPKTINYKLIANLPYYITAPLIRKFLAQEEVGLQPKEARLRSMTLIVQKEVAQRMCARPPKMSILAVSVQVYGVPKIISYVKKTSFWPKPKVDAAILQITPFSKPYPIDFHRFFTVVKAGFKQPRKQLVNNLSKGLGISRQQTEQWLLQNNIHPTRRAETLSIKDWVSLSKDVP